MADGDWQGCTPLDIATAGNKKDAEEVLQRFKDIFKTSKKITTTNDCKYPNGYQMVASCLQLYICADEALEKLRTEAHPMRLLKTAYAHTLRVTLIL